MKKFCTMCGEQMILKPYEYVENYNRNTGECYGWQEAKCKNNKWFWAHDNYLVNKKGKIQHFAIND